MTEIYNNPASGNYSISNANVNIFLDVLRNGLDNGIGSIDLPSPIRAITTEVSIFDGAGYREDAGKIDIIFNITTSDRSEMWFDGMTCRQVEIDRGPDDILDMGMAYRSRDAFESEEMHDYLLVGRQGSPNPLTTSLHDTQYLTFASDFLYYSPDPFDLGHFMQEHYSAEYAGLEGLPALFDDFVAQMYTNPRAGDFSVSDDYINVFLDVLKHGFDDGIASVLDSMSPSVITDIRTIVRIFDGIANPADAGKIDIFFDVTTSDGSDVWFESITCSPALIDTYGHGFIHVSFEFKPLSEVINSAPLLADTYGHGFIHAAFENRPLGDVPVFSSRSAHLLLRVEGVGRDNVVRIVLQSILLSLWGIATGIAVVLFLNNSRLVKSFLVPRIIVSIVIAAVFAVVMALADMDYSMAARALFATSTCLLYLPTYTWGAMHSPW